MSRDGWDLVVPETEATSVELVPTRNGWVPAPVSYTHLTLPTNREV